MNAIPDLERIDSEVQDVDEAATFDFVADPRGRSVPGAVWLPKARTPKALVLIGHGGSQYKRSPSVRALAERLVGGCGFAVAAIDGPIHGARRAPGEYVPLEQQRRFLDLWETGDGAVPSMVEDWKCALSALLPLAEIGSVPVGYAGISMGTAYGLPLIAADSRIQAAVVGMWSANYVFGDRLVSAASRAACKVLFIVRNDDELFDRPGTFQLFDAIGSRDKRMLVLPGKHVEGPEQFDQMAFFLDNSLPVDRHAAGEPPRDFQTVIPAHCGAVRGGR